MVKPDLILQDLRVALRSLWRTKGLAITVILTLALGIGANAAIFSLVRGVLLRPLVNRDEDRLIYIRQSAPGLQLENANFSVPEIQDLKGSLKTISALGDFSQIGFTMVGLGEPREVRAGVVGGSYFDVMGLRPVLGRLLNQNDDGPNAAGACVLTYRFWSTSLKSDPTVLGKTVRLGDRTATIIGVLEPSVPYPAQTEIIANVVTSPHHLSATMVQGRVHRMTELFGRLAPGATLDQANAELQAAYAAMVKAHPESYSPEARGQVHAVLLRDQISSGAKTVLWVLLAASLLIFIIACSNVANLILARSVRREGELAIRAALGASHRSVAAHAAGREPAVVRSRGRAGCAQRGPNGCDSRRLCLAIFRPCSRSETRHECSVGRSRVGDGRCDTSGVRAASSLDRIVERHDALQQQRPDDRQHQPPLAHVRGDPDCRLVHSAGRLEHPDQDPDHAAVPADRL